MGQILSNPVIDKEINEGSDGFTSFGLSTMQGWRMSMEDSDITELRLFNNDTEEGHLALYAIFDGHGGSSVSSKCSQAMALNIKNLIHRYSGKLHYKTILREAFLEIDQEIRDNQELVREQSGSTATMTLISKKFGKIICANSGDSRTVLCRDGVAKTLSYDHKPNMINELSRIVAAGGYVEMGRVNGNLALSRAIGDFTYKNDVTLPPEEQIVTVIPDIMEHSIDYTRDEFLVLACDGIWDCLSSQDCVNLIHYGINTGTMSLADISARIIDVCCAPTIEGSGIGCDNMSIVIVALLKDGETVEEWFVRMKQKDLPDTISFEERRRMIYSQYLPERDIFAITTPKTDISESRPQNNTNNNKGSLSNTGFQSIANEDYNGNNSTYGISSKSFGNDINLQIENDITSKNGSLDLFTIEKLIEDGIKQQQQQQTGQGSTSNEDKDPQNFKFNPAILTGMLNSFTTAAIGEPAPFLSEEEEESEREIEQSQ
ncbi:Protein phosphatase 2C 2 [Maudiozyma exigua]|uniref:protein-serine/threonine phosphatase n=1 Tax=Maudiozyma exigua TaxID=34358 RepID=A0A9P6W4G2_MAUEX|nr:Protein phosphatase 2C 2 [Kazachstania exigua]